MDSDGLSDYIYLQDQNRHNHTVPTKAARKLHSHVWLIKWKQTWNHNLTSYTHPRSWVMQNMGSSSASVGVQIISVQKLHSITTIVHSFAVRACDLPSACAVSPGPWPLDEPLPPLPGAVLLNPPSKGSISGSFVVDIFDVWWCLMMFDAIPWWLERIDVIMWQVL